MYSSTNFETVHCSMSSSNFSFLTCIQISQEAGKVVWYSYLFKNFPQLVVIHTVKGFSIVNEEEVDVFLEFPCFIYGTISSVQFSRSVASNSLWPHRLYHARPLCPSPTHGTMDVSNLISASSAFSKPNLYIWKFLVHILLKSSLKDFEHYLALMWNECNCMIIWTFFGLALLWDWNENWPFPVLWPPLHFPNLLAYWALSQHHLLGFEIAGNPSTPLGLFIVKLSKAHLTSYSRMSGSRWVTTPSLLSGSLRFFLYSSSVHSCHFLMSSASVAYMN